MKGISAIVATILMLLITISLAGTVLLYTSGILTSRTRALTLIDSYCAGTAATVTIRNEGPDTIAAGEQTLTQISGTCSGLPTLTAITSKTNLGYAFSGCGTGFHKFRLIGPSNALELDFTCA
jgi:flagellin-like protein